GRRRVAGNRQAAVGARAGVVEAGTRRRTGAGARRACRMNNAQWERLKELFQAALDQPRPARRDWLRQQCPDDLSIAHEAEALLDAHETAGAFLEQPAQ